MVNMENYEEYMMLYADSELNAEEEKALLDFVKHHPELEADLKAYAATRLLPDMEQVFAGKQALLKTEPIVKSIWIDRRMYAVAASIVLCVILYAVNRNSNKEEIATSIAVKETITVPVITPTPEPEVEEAVQQEQKFHSQPVNTVAVSPPRKHKEPSKPKPSPVTEEPVKIELVANKTVDTTKKLIAVDQQEPVSQEEKIDPIVVESNTIPGEPVKKKNRFIATVFGEKPEGLNELENAVQEKILIAKNIKEDVKNTEVTFQIGKRELFTVRL